MTDQAMTSQQDLNEPLRSAPMAVTGRLKRAIDAMVWQGLSRDDAAISARLQVHSVREALRKPHVKAYYLAQLDVLRTSERARNLLALTEVRDQRDNQMARVQAVKALEQLSDQEQARGGAAPAQPGIVIQIISNSPTKPLINQQGDLIDE